MAQRLKRLGRCHCPLSQARRHILLFEFHPFSNIFDSDSPELKVANQYFFSEEPFRFEMQGSYAAETNRRLWLQLEAQSQ